MTEGGNGIHFRLGDCERRMALLEAEVRGLEIGSLRRDMAHLAREVERSADRINKRMDDQENKFDDEAKYNRRMQWGLLVSVASAIIVLALASGVHP